MAFFMFLGLMQRKLESVFRATMVALAIMLIWSVWAAAQPVTNTNPPLGAALTNAPSSAASMATNAPAWWQTFGMERVSFLKRQVLGIPLWQYVASLLYVFLAFYASKMADWLLGHQLRRWAARTSSKLDDLVIQLLHGPVKVVAFVILLHIGLAVFQWPEWIETILSKGLKVIVAVSLTYLLVKLVDVALGAWKTKAAREQDQLFDDQLFPVIRKSLKLFVIIVAVLVTAQNLDFNITGLLASLSIGGLALGLAAQDTVANLFGAVSIFADKPFRIGDRIRIAPDVDGTVELIGLRSTRVRNLDGHLITIPNKTMGNATITNITRRPNIKTTMEIGVTYDTPADKVQAATKILEDIYRAHPMTQDVWISFHKFAESSLNILVVHWWNSTVYKDYLDGMQQLNLEIKRRFDAAGISFAFPTRTLYVKQDSQWQISGPPPSR